MFFLHFFNLCHKLTQNTTYFVLGKAVVGQHERQPMRSDDRHGTTKKRDKKVINNKVKGG